MSQPAPTARVLVLDDEASITHICSRVVRNLGAHADTAGTLGEAATLIRSGAYDLFVCDMRLPDGFGLDLETLFLQQNPCGQILVMTGSLTPDHPALENRAKEIVVLTKPFELSDFRRAVAGLLAERSGGKQSE